MWSVLIVPALGRDRRALDQRQEVPLHAFARHVGPAASLPSADLVDFIKEDDAVALDLGDRLAHDRVLIEQLFGLGGDQRLMRFGHCRTLGLRPLAPCRKYQRY